MLAGCGILKVVEQQEQTHIKADIVHHQGGYQHVCVPFILEQRRYQGNDCAHDTAQQYAYQRADKGNIAHKVYAGYCRHKAAQIEGALKAQVKLVGREHNAHGAAGKQQRDYDLYQVGEIRLAHKGSGKEVFYRLAGVFGGEQYQYQRHAKAYGYGCGGAQNVMLGLYAKAVIVQHLPDGLCVLSLFSLTQRKHLQSPRRSSS